MLPSFEGGWAFCSKSPGHAGAQHLWLNYQSYFPIRQEEAKLTLETAPCFHQSSLSYLVAAFL